MYHFIYRLNHTNDHDDNSKHHHCRSHVCAPAPRRQLNVAHGRQDVRHGHGTGCAHELKDDAQVARQHAQSRSTCNQCRADDEMPPDIKRLVGVKVRNHDLAADKCLQRQSRQHVEAKAQPRNVDHGVV